MSIAMDEYNNMSRSKVWDIRNNIVDKIIKELKKEYSFGYDDNILSVQHIYDYHQNYCVILRDKEAKEKVKEILKTIGAKKFRMANKGNAICFFMEDNLPLGVF